MLDRVNACAGLSVHVSKLSVLLSAEMGVAQYAPGFTKSISIFLIAIAITNGLLFESKINSSKVSMANVFMPYLYSCKYFSYCCTVECWG